MLAIRDEDMMKRRAEEDSMRSVFDLIDIGKLETVTPKAIISACKSNPAVSRVVLLLVRFSVLLLVIPREK